MPQTANKKRHRRRVSPAGAVFLFVMFLLIIFGIYGIVHLISGTPETEQTAVVETTPPTEPPTEPPTTEPPTTEPPPLVEIPVADENTLEITDQLNAEFAILIDCDTHRILAQKNADTKMYPASMTKLMTLIVAIENAKSMDDTFTMTQEILDELYVQDASMVGFLADEECSVKDMLYGASLPSGADATVGLANYVSGSERAFVRLMNQEAEKLGMTDTHFVNTSGLHDEKHYSTAKDMAILLEYCVENSMCRKVISTESYTTASTDQHPDGITVYDTMFKKFIDAGIPVNQEFFTIKGGKTGFTDEAGQCLASYAETADGHRYIAVTAHGTDRLQPATDAVNLYSFATGSPVFAEETTTTTEATTTETTTTEVVTASPETLAPAETAVVNDGGTFPADATYIDTIPAVTPPTTYVETIPPEIAPPEDEFAPAAETAPIF